MYGTTIDRKFGATMEFSWLFAASAPKQGVARQRQLYQQLREAILSGRVPAGTRLPATRVLARELSVARNTVLNAYAQLLAEGGLVADRQGTRVATLPAIKPAKTRDSSGVVVGLSKRAQSLPRSADAGLGAQAPFALGATDLLGFPFAAWRSAIDRAWRDARPAQLGYAEAGGESALRVAIAEHLRSFRGFAVGDSQVIITAGAQSAIDLAARLFADVGQTAWVENPGYLTGRAALSLAGLRLHAVAVDAEGMAPTAADWKVHSPRLIFLTPSHQFPTGAALSLPRRLALIEGARRAGACLLEDEYGSEFFERTPLPALFGLQAEAPVLYIGSFSKTMYPGLRLGYLVVPPACADAAAQLARIAQRPGQGIEQLALADFIRRGDYTRHLRRLRASVLARRQAMRLALAEVLGGQGNVSGDGAGQHLLLTLPSGSDDRLIAAAAAELGLACRALSGFCEPALKQSGLVLGYGAMPVAQIPAAVRRLAVVLERYSG